MTNSAAIFSHSRMNKARKKLS